MGKTSTMKRPKDLPDNEIMAGILEAIQDLAKKEKPSRTISVTDFAKSLGYESQNSIYNILKGISNISKNMEERLLEKYPQINVLYLKKGKGLPLREGSGLQSQNYIAQKYNNEPDKDFDEIRIRLNTIEKDGLENKMLLKRILEILEKK